MGPHEPKEAQAQSIDRLWPAATFVENINDREIERLATQSLSQKHPLQE